MKKPMLFIFSASMVCAFAQTPSDSTSAVADQGWLEEEMMCYRLKRLEYLRSKRNVSPAEAGKLLGADPRNHKALTPEAEARARALNQTFDKNGDGRIDPEEYIPSSGPRQNKLPPMVSDPEAMRLSKEREQARIAKLKSRTPTQIVREIYGQSEIDKYDLNKDGVLNDAEYAACEAGLRKEGNARFQVILKWYDINKDGFLDDKERVKFREDKKKGKITLNILNQEAGIK